MSSDRANVVDVEAEKDLDRCSSLSLRICRFMSPRKNLSGRITFANHAFCRLLGMTREEVVGKSDYDFFPKDLAEKYRHDDMLVERTGQTFSDIEANYSAGETRFFEVRKTPCDLATDRLLARRLSSGTFPLTNGRKPSWTRNANC